MTDIQPESKIPHEQKVIVDLLRLIAQSTKEHGTRIQGQCTIEIPDRPPVICMYASYPSGDFMCWFNDGCKFKMFSLVNGNLEALLDIPNTEIEMLQEQLTKIKSQMDEINEEFDAPEHEAR